MAQHAVPIKATFDASGRRLAGRPRFGSLRQRAPPVCPTTKIISLVTQDRLDVINGKVTSDYVILFVRDAWEKRNFGLVGMGIAGMAGGLINGMK
jgi:hypothetical protein